MLHITEGENREAEQDGEACVERNPDGALAHGWDVRPLEDNQNVCDENQQQNNERTNLKPCGEGAVNHARDSTSF